MTVIQKLKDNLFAASCKEDCYLRVFDCDKQEKIKQINVKRKIVFSMDYNKELDVIAASGENLGMFKKKIKKRNIKTYKNYKKYIKIILPSSNDLVTHL